MELRHLKDTFLGTSKRKYSLERVEEIWGQTLIIIIKLDNSK